MNHTTKLQVSSWDAEVYGEMKSEMNKKRLVRLKNLQVKAPTFCSPGLFISEGKKRTEVIVTG